MRRRRVLQSAAFLSLPAAAGCLDAGGDDEPTGSTTRATTTASATATVSATDLKGIYVQSFEEGMYVAGTKTAGDYAVGLMYAVPHRFWTVNGTERTVQPTEDDDNVHLMALVWDPETKTVLPEMGVSVEVLKDGSRVSEEVLYKMLSQRMGFHYGDNFALAGDGTYTARVAVGGTSVRRTGAFEGRFGEARTVSVEFPFTQETRDSISTRDIGQAGARGAVEPIRMGSMPLGRAPERESLPGSVYDTAADGSPARSNDCDFVLAVVEDAPRFGDGTYLAVSARSRYNGLFVPLMAMTATLERDGETVAEGRPTRTLDPELRYHYGLSVDDVRSGDRLTLSVDTPPQVARHEGYEEAFLRMPDVTFEL